MQNKSTEQIAEREAWITDAARAAYRCKSKLTENREVYSAHARDYSHHNQLWAEVFTVADTEDHKNNGAGIVEERDFTKVRI